MVLLGATLMTMAAANPPPFPAPELTETTAQFGERWDAWRDTVPRDEHAYPTVLRLYTEFESLKGEEDFRPQGSDQMWPEEFAQTAAFVRKHPEFIARLRTAALGPIIGASMDGYGVDHIRERRAAGNGNPEADPRPKIPITIVLPHYTEVPRLANLLIADALRAAEAGDAATVQSNIRQALRLSAYLDEPPVPLAAIVRCRIHADAARAVATLDLSILDDTSLVALDQTLSERFAHTEDRYLRELWMSTATIEWIFADAAEAGHLTPEGTRRWYSVYEMSSWSSDPISFTARAFGTASLAEHRDTYPVLVAAIRGDLAEPRHAIVEPAYERAIGQLDARRFGPLLLNAETAAHPAKVYERTTQHEQSPIAVRLRIAAERHRLRHGSFPESIAVMDDDLLAFDPIDLFTGEPLHYVLCDRGPRIYSSGPDRDHDNAEIVCEMPNWIPIGRLSEMNGAQREAINGDIVFFGTP